ncbi:MAG: hypothetical protein QM576_15515 [Rhodopseudomonas sp.]
MFNGSRLAHLKPGASLLAICEKIGNLYLVEHAPIERDVVYTESIPLRNSGVGLFKAGINIFYPSAHRTRNHDRRIPGGIMISINSRRKRIGDFVTHHRQHGTRLDERP